MTLSAQDLEKHWKAVEEWLCHLYENKNGSYEKILANEVDYICSFFKVSILNLFDETQKQAIYQHLEKIKAYKDKISWTDNELKKSQHFRTKMHIIQNKDIAQLKEIILLFYSLLKKEDNPTIQFLAEKQREITRYLNDKQKEINDKAGQILEEKLPRFWASTYIRESKILKKNIRHKEYLLYGVLVIIFIFFLIVLCVADKRDYVNYLPFFLPTIWGLWFLTKSISEDKRLFHEYKHKEVLARTYVLYADQIGRYSDYLLYTDTERHQYEALAFAFLSKNIDELTNNPAKSLDKNGLNNPYALALNQLIQKLSKEKNKE